MLGKILGAIKPSQSNSLAKTYIRLGWTGFWLQIALGSLPVIMMTYYFAFTRSARGTRGGLPFVEYLTIANIIVLLFTIFWSFRYTRLGKRMLSPQTHPSESRLISTVWTGVVASTIGMLFSMLILLVEAGHLLFYFLKTPQAGVPVIQTTTGDSVSWVSAVDMVSLMALTLTLMAELIVLLFSLWLLFRTAFSSSKLAMNE